MVDIGKISNKFVDLLDKLPGSGNSTKSNKIIKSIYTNHKEVAKLLNKLSINDYHSELYKRVERVNHFSISQINSHNIYSFNYCNDAVTLITTKNLINLPNSIIKIPEFIFNISIYNKEYLDGLSSGYIRSFSLMIRELFLNNIRYYEFKLEIIYSDMNSDDSFTKILCVSNINSHTLKINKISTYPLYNIYGVDITDNHIVLLNNRLCEFILEFLNNNFRDRL